jgi:pantoate--beta-alanine ligase
MIVCTSQDELLETQERWASKGFKVGFVPTMGALHEGHLSLVRLAQARADRVVVSIYVNPTQFAPHEDFDSYPRTIEADLALLDQEGVNLVYLPSTDEIYPHGAAVTTRAGDEGQGLETDFRPHFFDGVASVVHRLFEIVKPTLAVFGEKDYQQLMVIREMAQREGLGIEIIGGEIARDAHGLALSSRNAYLSAEELEIARMLNQIVYKAAEDGDLAAAREMILACGFDKVDYVEERWGRVLAAAWIGRTRLIDNCAA